MTSLALRNARTSVLDRQPAPAFWLVETLWLMMAAMAQTHNRFSMMEQVMGGGLGPPTHRHSQRCPRCRFPRPTASRNGSQARHVGECTDTKVGGTGRRW